MACEKFIVKEVSKSMVERIIKALLRAGASVKGDNPWDIMLEDKNIVLIADWYESTNTLSIKITRKPFLAPCRVVVNRLKEEIEKSKLQNLEDDIFDFNLNIDA
ncbi:hypothetical protein [Hyunsoonleella pacifica]|uniref:DUF3630 family protein n=1 Tax=Hyunsoonleella pacifica TaxID=1080224 RepID=A0A4Q9FSE0_9FLAO|nr:hypothetical protein [Hyunsoonleella pacifica]TBN17776.1 hypothetical protein EYD46_05545 [Hyunsoonleella pacifica]GGD09055.1 hypothetical protein GCM10011368_08740 [Hyunsoonleella pacifica]